MSESAADDDALLDALLDRAVRDVADGRALDADALLPGRPDLRERVEEIVRIASDIAPRRPAERPSFAGYEIVRELGRGGMGTVYLARHLRLGRTVALKVLPRRLASGRERERFEREARAVARLEHPLIVPIYDLGESDGHAYFTMAFVEGATLAAAIRAVRGRDAARLGGDDFARAAVAADAVPARWEGPWWRAAVQAAIDVAEALGHAHAQGVIHRDVKPSNAMLRRDGFALVFDFGLAAVEDEATLTLTHGFLGTPHYASPEQAAGATDGIDARTDVFSLGSTLWEALTLRVPFPGPTTHEVLRRVQTWEPDPPSKLNSAVPEALDTVVLAAMEKDPRRRFASMGAFADDLRAVLAGRGIRARRAGLVERGLRSLKRGRALTDLLVEQQARNAELRSAVLRAERNEKLAEERAAEAERERRSAESIALFLREMLAAADPSAGGRDVRVADLLDRAAARTASLAASPEVRAEIERTIVMTYLGLGLNEAARDLASDALARAASDLGGGSRSRWALENLAGVATSLAGDLGRGIGACRAAAEGGARAFGSADPDVVRWRADAAHLAAESGDAAAAEPLLRGVLADADTVLGGAHAVTLAVRHNLALLLLRTGRRDEGLALLRAALEGRTRAIGLRHPDTLVSLASLGQELKLDGAMEEAAALLERAAALCSEVLGPSHRYTAMALHNLAGLRMDEGRVAEALGIQRAAVASGESSFAGSPNLGVLLAQLARLLDATAARDEAVPVARRSLALLGDAGGALVERTRRIAAGEAAG